MIFSLVGTGTMEPIRVDTPAYLAYRTSLSACRVLIATRCAAPRCMLSVLCARIWMLATICVSARYTVERCYCIHPCAERALPWCLRCLEHHKSLVLEHALRPTLSARASVPNPALRPHTRKRCLQRSFLQRFCCTRVHRRRLGRARK